MYVASVFSSSGKAIKSVKRLKRQKLINSGKLLILGPKHGFVVNMRSKKCIVNIGLGKNELSTRNPKKSSFSI